MVNLYKLIENYQKLNNNFKQNTTWIIQKSKFGRGLFAKRGIEEGEIIFKDNPLLIGPRFNKDCPIICVNCYKNYNLRPCTKNCGLPVCSEKCENSEAHKTECQLILQWIRGYVNSSINKDLLKCLTPIRGLLLNNTRMELLCTLEAHPGAQHGLEIDVLKRKLKLNVNEEEENLMNLICSILDTNAFEVVVDEINLRAVYPLGSLMNHGCVPNIIHYFDSDQNMIVKATKFIPKGQEILHCYTKLFWGTLVRQQYLLKTKHFRCRCDRCRDPTEFETNLSAINCLKCRDGFVLPFFHQTGELTWKCVKCKRELENEKAGLVMSVLGNRLNNLLCADVDDILRFLKKQLARYAPASNQIGVQLKFRLIWLIGHGDKYRWTDLSDDLLNEKERICRELLQLLATLKAGQSKMRGLLLYELYCCLRERRRRAPLESKDEVSKEAQLLFDESRKILEDDVNAPEEIKNYKE